MRIILLIFVMLFPYSHARSQSVIVHPNPGQTPALKWSWALNQGAAFRSDFWIGYSIERLMGESEYVGTNIRFDGGTLSGTFRGSFAGSKFIGRPLVEILKGRSQEEPFVSGTDDEQIGKAARETLRSLEQKPASEKKVTKEIALLFRMRSQGGNKSLGSVQYGNLILPFEHQGLPIIWLGKTDPAQSISQLIDFYQLSQMKEIKRKLIDGIGLHPLPGPVVRFAAGIIKDKDTENDLRKAAVYALQDQQNGEAVQLLKDTIQSDLDAEVRKAAAYALAEQEDAGVLSFLVSVAISESNGEVAKAACYALADRPGEATFKALADILEAAKSLEVRKASLYAIADHGAGPAMELLMTLAMSDQSEELAKAALYALADLLEPDGTKELLQVHQNARIFEVRKAAIYALADQEGPKTVDALGEILKTEKDLQFRKAAVYALADIESDRAIDVLIHIVENDSNREIRKAAIYALGDIDSPKARSALIGLLKEPK